MKQQKSGSRKCEVCGKRLERKIIGNHKEDWSNFRRRRHCNRICGNSRRILKPKSYYYRSRKYRKSQCESCGLTHNLHVHHQDQNQTNNDPLNLQTLCTHCHHFLHKTMQRTGMRGLKILGGADGKTIRLVPVPVKNTVLTDSDAAATAWFQSKRPGRGKKSKTSQASNENNPPNPPIID